ncbi:MAG TPA: hypothetical protein VK585_15355 [Jiangellaceae bacterium]|nr:hypothetical protein [Jiangellaceae bacterium]
MLPHTYDAFGLRHDDRAEAHDAAERQRTALHVLRARRMERWARRSVRLSRHLDRLAGVQRARLS